MSPTPAARARELARWSWAGALVGLVLGLAHAPYPWAGRVAAVIGEAAGGAIILGLIARAACWLWLKRRSA